MSFDSYLIDTTSLSLNCEQKVVGGMSKKNLATSKLSKRVRRRLHASKLLLQRNPT